MNDAYLSAFFQNIKIILYYQIRFAGNAVHTTCGVGSRPYKTIMLCVCVSPFKFLTNWQIFAKLGMEAMPLEAKPASYISICYNRPQSPKNMM